MAGGDRITYSDKVSIATSNTSIAKLIINSTISTAGTRYMCTDRKGNEWLIPSMNLGQETPHKMPGSMTLVSSTKERDIYETPVNSAKTTLQSGRRLFRNKMLWCHNQLGLPTQQGVFKHAR
eukprot:5711808-Ditylum_brightwellii.AAC.1